MSENNDSWAVVDLMGHVTVAGRGFRVQRGRGSQLALFIVAAANNACTLTGGILPPEKPLSTPKQLPRSRKLSKPATRK